MFLSQRWTVAEPSLAKEAKDAHHGIAMAIDGPDWDVMTIGEKH